MFLRKYKGQTLNPILNISVKGKVPEKEELDLLLEDINSACGSGPGYSVNIKWRPPFTKKHQKLVDKGYIKVKRQIRYNKRSKVTYLVITDLGRAYLPTCKHRRP